MPWIADFRDPWTLSDTHRALPGWRQWADARLERSNLYWADRVVCNTDRARQEMVRISSRLPAEKFVTLTNGFDDPVRQPPSPSRHPRERLLLHLGSLYGSRRIDTFCQAMEKLRQSGEIDFGSLKILFVGDAEQSYAISTEKTFPELTRTGCLVFRPLVKWTQAQEILAKADLLLAFYANPLAVPAKFYEYLQTGKPIFAVTPPGALTDILTVTESGLWANPDDVNEIATQFLRALSLPPKNPAEVQARWSGQYHFRSLAARLATWLRELVPVNPA